MNVCLTGGPMDGKVCVWYPDASNSVFPLLLLTKDGQYYRCTRPTNARDEVKAQDDLVYFFDDFNTRRPARLAEVIRNSMSDTLEPSTEAELVAALEPVQKYIHELEGGVSQLRAELDHTRSQLRIVKNSLEGFERLERLRQQLEKGDPPTESG